MRVVERVVTSASPEIVWQVLADVEHWSDWTPTVTQIVPEENVGLMVGARYRVVQPGLRPAVYEVTDCSPDQRFTWEQKVLGGSMIADHRLRACNDGTEVELAFSSKGLLATIAGNLLLRKIWDYVRTEAKSLKNHCDALKCH